MTTENAQDYTPPAPFTKRLANALELILPMARGYAATHPVGNNAAFIAGADALLKSWNTVADLAPAPPVSPGVADLVARLREADANSVQRIFGSRIFKEAADMIEALAAGQREAWRDIATDPPPMDGTSVLGTALHWNGDCLVMGWHFGGWREVADPNEGVLSATHWQPLPAPPARSGGAT